MNGPKHLHLARRDLSASYRAKKGDARPYAELQLRTQQAQAHALIALVHALIDVGTPSPDLETDVREALQVANNVPIPDPPADLVPPSADKQLPDWTTPAPAVADVAADIDPFAIPANRIEETPAEQTRPDLRLIPRYFGAHERGMC